MDPVDAMMDGTFQMVSQNKHLLADIAVSQAFQRTDRRSDQGSSATLLVSFLMLLQNV